MNHRSPPISIAPIVSESQYEAMLDWVDDWLDVNPSPESPEGLKLQQALMYIQEYEDIHYPVPPSP